MKYNKYAQRETMSLEGRTEVEMMGEIERLFRELENDETNEERREELAEELRKVLGKYKRLFGQEDTDAEELLQGYEDRLRNDLVKKAA